MKKLFFGIMIIALISLSISSQSILIKSPKGGSKWVPGKSMEINWTAQGKMNKDVKITLLGAIARTQIMKISVKTPNDGNFRWSIPKSIGGGNYFIRVKTVDNKVTKDSGKVFIGFEKKKDPPVNSNTPNYNPNAANIIQPQLVKQKKNVLVVDPVVVTFKPERETINYGESVKLFFHYKKAMKAHIYNRTVYTGDLLKNPKFPEFNSFIIVKPEKTSRFEVNVFSAFKSITRECFVTVKGGPPTPPPPPPSTGKLPQVTLFKAVPKVVDFGKGTTLKLKATNASSIVITDPKGIKVFTWTGSTSATVNKDIPVKLYKEKNTYKLVASNSQGNHSGAAWATWKSVIRDFSIKSVNNQYITFKYDYSLAETAYIKKLNTNTNKWDKVLTLHCYGISCARERKVKFSLGKYRLELIGSQGIVYSSILKIH